MAWLSVSSPHCDLLPRLSGRSRDCIADDGRIEVSHGFRSGCRETSHESALSRHETQHRIRIREPVKSAARTDTVTGIRLNRCGMIDDRVQRRKNRRMRPVTQIAMRRAYRQPRHHHAQQPGSYAGCGFDDWLHFRIILRQGIAAVIRGRSEFRFG